MFCKTANGVAVGNLQMAQIATADPFDYLTELQHHASEIAATQSEWMPRNHQDTLARPTATD